MWLTSPLAGPIVPLGAKVKFYQFSPRDHGRVHQVGTKVLPGKFMRYSLIVGRRWIGGQLIVDTEDLKTLPPSEIHVKRFKPKEVDIQEKETLNLYSHTGRAKSCKQDSCYPTLCTDRGRPQARTS